METVWVVWSLRALCAGPWQFVGICRDAEAVRAMIEKTGTIFNVVQEADNALHYEVDVNDTVYQYQAELIGVWHPELETTVA